MASIGTVSLFSIRHGVVNPPAEEVEDITRPWADGVALRLAGRKGKPFMLVGIQFHATEAAAKTHILACKALTEEDPMTVTDDAGTDWTNIAVTDVRVRRKARRHATNVQYRTDIEFECVDAST